MATRLGIEKVSNERFIERWGDGEAIGVFDMAFDFKAIKRARGSGVEEGELSDSM